MSGIFDQIINYSPPLIVSGTVNYKGTWNASTNNPTLNSSPAASTKGDYYVVSTAGTQFGITFAIGDWIISNGTAWEKVDLTDAVSSVFGRTGAVVGVSTDYSAVGLTNTAIGASNPSTGAFTTVTASSTIAATGAVTGSNLSGTNTGDQTTITGNAGSATVLQTARAIYGNNFDGSAALTQVIASTYGGTGNGFAKFSGPASSEKTFTLPNASSTLLYEGGTIGATTANTGAFTTLTSTLSSTTTNGTIRNTSAGTGAIGGFYLGNDSSATAGVIGVNSSTSLLGSGGVGGPLALQVNNLTNNPVSIGVNNTIIGNFSSTGLAVTGALSSTTGFSTTGNSTFTEPTLGTTSCYLGMSTTGAYFGTAAAKPVYFETNGTERLRIDSSGNVGIGTTPSAWNSDYKVIQLGFGASIYGRVGNNETAIVQNWYRDSSGNFKYLGNGYATSYSQLTGGGQAWYNAPNNTSGAGAALTLTQAMTLDASGNLGINTSSPTTITNYKSITIDGSTGSILDLRGGGTLCGRIVATSGGMSLETGGGSQFINFYTGGAERARIDSSGVLCVGQTSFGFALRAGFRGDSTSVPTVEIQNESATGKMLTFRTNGESEVGSVSFTTAGVLYNVTSDYRRKSNVQNLTGSGTFIDALKPRTFDWDTGDKGVGFIAHEFAEVSPSSVNGEKDAVDSDGKPVYQAMQASSTEVIANLVAELQSVRQRLAALEA